MVFSSFVFIDRNNALIFFLDKKEFESSANMTRVKFEEALKKKLFIQIRNNSGPIIELCSTQHVISL